MTYRSITKPPLSSRLRYRVLGWLLPAGYRDWVEDDLASATWNRRHVASTLGAMLVSTTVVVAVAGTWAMLLGALVGSIVAAPFMLMRAERTRQATLDRHHRLWGDP